MNSLIIKLFLVLILTCAPAGGFCAGDEQLQASRNDKNSAISDGQPFWGCSLPEIWSMIADFVNSRQTRRLFRESRLALSEEAVALANRLSTAAQEGNMHRVESLLMEAPAELRAEYMGLAVIAVARNEHIEAVRTLLAEQDMAAHYRNLAIIEAIAREDIEIVELLLAGGHIDAQHRGQAVIEAVGRADTEIVELLLADGADIDARVMGQAIVEAAQDADTEMFELLLAARADIDARVMGELVIYAADRGLGQAVRMLLEAGADIDAQVISELLIKVAHFRRAGVVEALLAHAAEIGVVIDAQVMGQAVIRAVDDFGEVKIVELLLGAGADVTVTDSNGNTALDLARQNYANEPMVRILEPFFPSHIVNRTFWRAGRYLRDYHMEIISSIFTIMLAMHYIQWAIEHWGSGSP